MTAVMDRIRASIHMHTPSKETIKQRCTSIKAWELPKQDSALAPDYVWTNKDMDPVPVEDQTWTLWTWMAYWATDTINLGTWETVSIHAAVSGRTVLTRYRRALSSLWG